jgi:hypothetical protein
MLFKEAYVCASACSTEMSMRILREEDKEGAQIDCMGADTGGGL